MITNYKGNGYGKRQMQEAVKRIIAQGTVDREKSSVPA